MHFIYIFKDHLLAHALGNRLSLLSRNLHILTDPRDSIAAYFYRKGKTRESIRVNVSKKILPAKQDLMADTFGFTITWRRRTSTPFGEAVNRPARVSIAGSSILTGYVLRRRAATFVSPPIADACLYLSLSHALLFRVRFRFLCRQSPMAKSRLAKMRL